MAPEIILRCGHGAASDWWSIGILLCERFRSLHHAVTLPHGCCRYELLVGETPFGRGSPKATMALIAETTKDPYFPSYLSTYAIDVIKRLLTRDQASRLVRLRLRGSLSALTACAGLWPRWCCCHQDPPIFQGARLECVVEWKGTARCRRRRQSFDDFCGFFRCLHP